LLFLSISCVSVRANAVDFRLLVCNCGCPLLLFISRFAFSIMKRFLPEEKVEGVKGLSLTADGMGAVFDVPADDLSLFLEGMLNCGLTIILSPDRLDKCLLIFSPVLFTLR